MGDELREVLGADPPAGLTALPPDQRARLAQVISSARRRQAQDLAASFETTLRHVPFPLRGVVKKVLMG